MKVIDLLNKIANGEEVPHFKVGEIEYFLNWRGNLLEREEEKPSADVQWYIDKDWLNTEVEIIEEDKKIDFLPMIEDDEIFITSCAINQTRRKINEIINKINGDK